MIIAKNILKSIGVVILAFLLVGTVFSASLIAQTLFSGDLGRVIVGVAFFAYVLFFGFSSSLMALWVSYWILPRWTLILLAILILCGFISSLMLIPLAMNAGMRGIFPAVPPALYFIVIFRLFRKSFLIRN